MYIYIYIYIYLAYTCIYCLKRRNGCAEKISQMSCKVLRKVQRLLE